MVFYREQSKNSSGFGVLSSFDIPLLMYGAHTLGPLREREGGRQGDRERERGREGERERGERDRERER